MRCAASIAIAIIAASSSIATEPGANLAASRSSARTAPNDFQRVLARLAARDRAATNDVAKFLVRPQPDLARFVLNRCVSEERQTGIREDDFVAVWFPQRQPSRPIPDELAELVAQPMKLVARRLESLLPAIPLIERFEAKIEQKRELRREVIRNLTLLTSPQPQFGQFFQTQDANYRMLRLLNESEDLRQARAEMHRFWMNNQPRVLTYERLNGAIGP